MKWFLKHYILLYLFTYLLFWNLAISLTQSTSCIFEIDKSNFFVTKIQQLLIASIPQCQNLFLCQRSQVESWHLYNIFQTNCNWYRGASKVSIRPRNVVMIGIVIRVLPVFLAKKTINASVENQQEVAR